MSLQSFTLPAYAKINWRLHVLGRRADGFHELRTIFQTVTLQDRLIFAQSETESLALTCDDASIPVDERNLVLRAARALREKYEVRAGARVHLEKRIPAEAGLGGGSSDAAITLLGLAHLWRIKTNREALAEIGASLGADVPFFLTGGTALGTGLGTEIEPLADVRAERLLIVKPRAKVSTAEAYKALKRPALTKEMSDIILSISRAEARLQDSLHEVLHNDFEPAIYALYPEIAHARARLIEQGASGALLAGSGASVFGIFDNEEALDRARSVLGGEPGWRVFRSAAIGRSAYMEALGACAALLQ
ncbi:MAG: 4-(cytidine 5'-diphospho)-2-C-methyl-D-erythritol kinase [Pyrinomonadaceae bacterium]|nr:4-(cytidine 5'-diphospho)-2-C-methyl-D-erythritol kinase [Pyrinomonadaceae bacterium]